MKPKSVTTQMKALDEYFLMVVFTLLLNTVHVFVNFMFNLALKGYYVCHFPISIPTRLKLGWIADWWVFIYILYGT